MFQECNKNCKIENTWVKRACIASFLLHEKITKLKSLKGFPFEQFDKNSTKRNNSLWNWFQEKPWGHANKNIVGSYCPKIGSYMKGLKLYVNLEPSYLKKTVTKVTN